MKLINQIFILQVVISLFFSCSQVDEKSVQPEVTPQLIAVNNNVSIGMKEIWLDWRENPFNDDSKLLPMIVFYPEWMDDYSKYLSDVRVNVFLHGIGERGSSIDDLGILMNHYLPKMLPGVVRNEIYICPQISGNWSGVNLEKVYDMLNAEFPNALEYGITGLSLGGMGTYNMLEKYPYFFSDAAILCGKMSNPEDRIPMDCSANIIAWHGDKDNTVSYSSGKTTISKLVEAGYQKRCEFVTISGVGHNIWNHVYYNTNKYFDFIDENVSNDPTGGEGIIPDQNEEINIYIEYDNYFSEAYYQIKDGTWLGLKGINDYTVSANLENYGFRIYAPSASGTYDLEIRISDANGNIAAFNELRGATQGDALSLFTSDLNSGYSVEYVIVQNGEESAVPELSYDIQYDGYNQDAIYQVREEKWTGLKGDDSYVFNNEPDKLRFRIYTPVGNGKYDVAIQLLDDNNVIIEEGQSTGVPGGTLTSIYSEAVYNTRSVKFVLIKL